MLVVNTTVRAQGNDRHFRFSWRQRLEAFLAGSIPEGLQEALTSSTAEYSSSCLRVSWSCRASQGTSTWASWAWARTAATGSKG